MSNPSWDERYGAASFFYGTEPNDFVVEVAARIPPGPVLCLAEGEGRNAVFLAQGGRPVTAVDASTVGLQKAGRLAAQKGVALTTRAVDLADFDLGVNAWSGIVATWAHLPPGLRRRVHAQVVAALVPGGVYILEAYTPAQLAFGTGGPKDPLLLMTLEGLRAELAGLSFEVGREVERRVVEGRGHTGLSAVVQVLARKPPSPAPA